MASDDHTSANGELEFAIVNGVPSFYVEVDRNGYFIGFHEIGSTMIPVELLLAMQDAQDAQAMMEGKGKAAILEGKPALEGKVVILEGEPAFEGKAMMEDEGEAMMEEENEAAMEGENEAAMEGENEMAMEGADA